MQSTTSHSDATCAELSVFVISTGTEFAAERKAFAHKSASWREYARSLGVTLTLVDTQNTAVASDSCVAAAWAHSHQMALLGAAQGLNATVILTGVSGGTPVLPRALSPSVYAALSAHLASAAPQMLSALGAAYAPVDTNAQPPVHALRDAVGPTGHIAALPAALYEAAAALLKLAAESPTLGPFDPATTEALRSMCKSGLETQVRQALCMPHSPLAQQTSLDVHARDPSSSILWIQRTFDTAAVLATTLGHIDSAAALQGLQLELAVHAPSVLRHNFVLPEGGSGVAATCLNPQHVAVHADYLVKISEAFDSLMRTAILSAARRNQPCSVALACDAAHHAALAEIKASVFYDREDMNQVVAAYLANQDSGRSPCALVGPSGAGKSALLAHMAQSVTSAQPNAVVAVRFLGTSPSMTTARGLLRSLCVQLINVYHMPSASMETFAKLAALFPVLLARATAERPLFIFLDALHRLKPDDGGRDLHWLPARLPLHVYIVASCESSCASSTLQALLKLIPNPEHVIDVKPFTDAQAAYATCKLWLDAALRTVSPAQRANLLEIFAGHATTPLHARLWALEAASWTSSQALLASELPFFSVDEHVARIVGRLEQRYPSAGLFLVCGLLAVSQHGLAPSEIEDLLLLEHSLRRAPLVTDIFPAGQVHCLILDLSSLLVRNCVCAVSVVAWAHTLVRQAVLNLVAPNYEALGRLHTLLAKYFLGPDSTSVLLPSGSSLLLQPLSFEAGERDVVFGTGRVLGSRAVDATPYFPVGASAPPTMSGGDELTHSLDPTSAGPDNLLPTTDDVGARSLSECVSPSGPPILLENGEALLSVVPAVKRRSSKLLLTRRRSTTISLDPSVHDNDGSVRFNMRKLSELPFHLLAAGLHGDLVTHCLGNFLFLIAKLRAFGLGDVLSDFLAIPPDAPMSPELASVFDVLKLCGPIISVFPEQLASQLLGRLPDQTARSVLLKTLHRHAYNACAVDAKVRLAPSRQCLTGAGGTLMFTVKGASDGVVAAVVDATGPSVVSTYRTEVLVWDIFTGIEIRKIRGHTDKVLSLCIVPHRNVLLTGGADKRIREWPLGDLGPGNPTRVLSGHTGGVRALASFYDHDSHVEWMASAGSEELVRVWTFSHNETWEPLHTLDVGSAVHAVAFTATGKWLLVANQDASLGLWDVQSGEVHRIFIGHAGPVRCVAAANDDQFVMSGAADGAIKVWALGSGQGMRTIVGHTDAVLALALSSDGRLVVSGSADRSSRVFDVLDGRQLCCFIGHTDAIATVVLSPDGGAVVTGSLDKTLKVWDLTAITSLQSGLRGTAASLRALAATPDGRHVLTAASGNVVRVWDVLAQKVVATLKGHTGWVLAVVITPNGRLAITGGGDSTVRVWNFLAKGNGGGSVVCSGHTGPVLSVAATRGAEIVSGSEDCSVRLWDLASAKELAKWETAGAHPVALCVCPANRFVAAGLSTGCVNLWTLATRALAYVLPVALGHVVGALCVDSGGARLFCGAADHKVTAWDLSTGLALGEVFEHHGPVMGLALTIQDAFLVSASADKTVC